MEQVIFEKLQLLPEALQQDALHYIEALIVKHQQQDREPISDFSSNQKNILVVFDQIGKEAQEKGLTDDILAGLLADES
jgi:hypothetical protein